MKRIEMKFIVNIKDSDINTIVTIAGDGTRHWSVNKNRISANLSITEHIRHGGDLLLHAKVGDEDYYLTNGNFIDGIQKYIENPIDGDILKYADGEMQIDATLIDEDVVDSILQYGVFGKIIYRQGVRV